MSPVVADNSPALPKSHEPSGLRVALTSKPGCDILL